MYNLLLKAIITAQKCIVFLLQKVFKVNSEPRKVFCNGKLALLKIELELTSR